MAEVTKEVVNALAAELLKELCCEEFEKILAQVHGQHVSLVFIEVRDSRVWAFTYATTLDPKGAIDAFEILHLSRRHGFGRRDLPGNGRWMPNETELMALAESIKAPKHVALLLLVGEGGHTVFAATAHKDNLPAFLENDLLPKLREDARA